MTGTGADAGGGGHGVTDDFLIVSSASLEVRRVLGPAAWSTLEVLAFRAHRGPDGVLTATLGVRELAMVLGVGRDAAARALIMLREQGLVSATQDRAGKGRFDGTRYRIELPPGLAVVPSAPTRSRATRPAQPTRRPAPQPSLFDNSAPPPRVSTRSGHEAKSADHSAQAPPDRPKKLHELAFDRMPTLPGRIGPSC